MDKQPFSLRLTLLCGLLLLIATGALLWAANRTVTPLLVAEMQKNSAAVGRSLIKQFSGAVASGIPLQKLAGVNDMLGEVLDDNPTLNGMEVIDPAGRLLFSAGARLPADDEGGFSAITRPVISTLPILVNGTPVGALRVGSDLSFTTDRLWLYIAATFGLIIASLVVIFEVVRLILARAIDAPSSQLGGALHHVLEGDFSAALAVNAPGVMGRAIRRLNTNLRTVADRFERFAASANAIRGLDLDAASADRLSRMLEDAKTRFPTLATDGRRLLPQIVTRPDGRWVMLMLTIVSEAVRPLVPVVGSDRVLGGLEPLLLAAVPLGLALVGVGFGTVMAPLVRPQRMNLVFLISVLLFALSLVATAATHSAVVFWASRLVGGIAIGIAWRMLTTRYRTDMQHDPNIILVAGLGFQAVGPVIGAVLGEGLGVNTALWLIAAASIFCAFYGWNSLRAATPTPDTPASDEISTLPSLWGPATLSIIAGALLFQALPVLSLSSGTLLASIPHFAAFGIGLLISAFVMPSSERRLGVGLLLATLALTGFAIFPDVLLCAVALLVFGLGWGMARPFRPVAGLLLVDMAGGLIGVSLGALVASANMPLALLLLGLPALLVGAGQILRPQPTARQER
jgi:MFS family permease/HAMP domain-containing protein